jgi:uncharacterized protein YbcI
MKKLFFVALATCAICFTSCDSKKAQTEATESESETVASADLENATAELAAELESGDVNKFQEALNAAQAKVAELVENDPETAQLYLEKVQSYLKENTEKIKEVVGDNALVSTAVNTLIETPAESVINNLKAAASSVEEAATDKVDELKEQAQQQNEEAKAAVDQKVQETKAAAEQKVEEAKQAAASKVNEGANKINEKVNEGADKLLKDAGLK